MYDDISTFKWVARCMAAARVNMVSFFLRDDVSRMTTGKKETVTHMKQWKQKRLLTDTLKKSVPKIPVRKHRCNFIFHFLYLQAILGSLANRK